MKNLLVHPGDATEEQNFSDFIRINADNDFTHIKTEDLVLGDDDVYLKYNKSTSMVDSTQITFDSSNSDFFLYNMERNSSGSLVAKTYPLLLNGKNSTQPGVFSRPSTNNAQGQPVNLVYENESAHFVAHTIPWMQNLLILNGLTFLGKRARDDDNQVWKLLKQSDDSILIFVKQHSTESNVYDFCAYAISDAYQTTLPSLNQVTLDNILQTSLNESFAITEDGIDYINNATNGHYSKSWDKLLL